MKRNSFGEVSGKFTRHQQQFRFIIVIVIATIVRMFWVRCFVCDTIKIGEIEMNMRENMGKKGKKTTNI